MIRAVLAVGALSVSLLVAPNLGAKGVIIDLPIARPLAVAFSPDGNQVAVGGLETVGSAPIDGLVILVDAGTGQQQSALRHSGTIKDGNSSSGSMNLIHELAYSPDSQSLAVATDLGLKLWDAKDGAELATLRGYGVADPKDRWKTARVEVSSVAFSNDSKLMAIKYGEKIELWDAQTRKPIREMETFGNAHVTFFEGSSLLASVSYQNDVHLWDVASGKQLGQVRAEMGPLYGVAVNADGSLLAAVGEGGEKRWHIGRQANGSWEFTDEVRLRGQTAPVRHVAFSPDGKLLATAGDIQIVTIYDTQTREMVGIVDSGSPFAFSPDGKSLAVAEQIGEGQKRNTRLTILAMAEVLDARRMAAQARKAATELVRVLSAEQRRSADRLVAPRALAILGGPHSSDAAPILIEALAKDNIQEKQVIAMVLGRLAAAHAEARKAVSTALVKTLRNDQAVDARLGAAMTLSQLPPEAFKEAAPALAEVAINDESPNVRSAVAGLLQRLDPAAYRQVDEKTRAGTPVKAEVVRRAGKLFYQGRSLEEWIKRLSVAYIPNEIFGRPRPDEPLAAIRAIGVEGVPVLIKTLKSDQWPMRQAGIAGLERLGEQARPAVEPLVEVIAGAKEDDLTTTSKAADAIAAVLKGTKEPPEKLVALLKSEKLGVRITAARAIAQIKPEHKEAIQTLRDAWGKTWPEKLSANEQKQTAQKPRDAVDVRYRDQLHFAAGEALNRLHVPLPPPSGGSWQPGVTQEQRLHPEMPQQFRPPTVESLSETIADPKSPGPALVTAARMLQPMGEKGLPALPSLLEAVAREQDRGVSRHLEMAIQRLGPKAVPGASDALKNASSDETRRRLITTLSGIGTEGQRALQELLKSNPALGRALSGSMPQLGGNSAQLKDGNDMKGAAKHAPEQQTKRQARIATTPHFDVHLQSKDVEIKGWVDTITNTFTIASWSDASGVRWTPQAKELPLVLHSYKQDGTAFDVPQDWNGQLSGFTFLLPTDQDLRSVMWNEGTPSQFWKGASFGWGGLRNSLGKVVLADRTRFRYLPSAGGGGTTDLNFDTVTITARPRN